MRTPHQALPSGNSQADILARELTHFLGTAYQPADGTLLAEDLRVWGQALADARATVDRAAMQAIADQATDLLSAWEERLGLPNNASASVADRQAAIRAKRRAGAKPTERNVLAALQPLEPAAVIYRNGATTVTASPRKVFVWAVKITATVWNDTNKRMRIQEIIQQMKPAHTLVRTPVTVGFLCDDANSLTNRDLLRI